MILALIDGDIVAHRCAASIEPTKIKPEREEASLAIRRADELLYRIITTLETDKYRVYLSGSENFRYHLYPDYKANRRNLPRPQELDSVRGFLAGEWNAQVCSGYEADDGIGIAAKEGFVICSIDKDFKQIAGTHYNFVTESIEEVDDGQAAYNFWAHMLIGDSSDNVRGVDGIGPVKARRALQGLSSKEMEATVMDLYGDRERFFLNRMLLRILRSEDDYVRICETIERQSKGQEVTTTSEGPDSILLSGVNPK